MERLISRYESCCCVCSLKTGTVILISYSLITALLFPFCMYNKISNDPEGNLIEHPLGILGPVIGIIFWVCGLYSAYAERPRFLLFYLIFLAIETITIIYIELTLNFVKGFLCFLVSLPFFFFGSVMNKYYRKIQEENCSSTVV